MLRMIATICLSTLLALSSVTMAMARADAAIGGPVMELVLCTTEGEARVYLDAQGEPVSPHRHCPDCVAGMAVDLAAPFGLGAWVTLAQDLRFDDAPRLALPYRALPALARGPPALA